MELILILIGLIVVIFIILIVILVNNLTKKINESNKSEGYFVQMLSQSQEKGMENASTFNLTGPNPSFPTTRAFTFINNQTAPIIFLQVIKGYDPSGVGLLFDSSLSKLVTNFSLIDSDSYSRITCSNDTDSKTPKYTYGSSKTGTPYPTQCSSEDNDCMILNSGGSASFFSSPCNGTSTNCSDDCLIPQICPDGSQAVHFNSYTNFSLNQCKYIPSQFDQWVDDLHNLYQRILDGELDGQDIPHFENEFNIYIYPDSTSDIYKNQNEIFQKSIYGVIYSDIDWVSLGGKSKDDGYKTYAPKDNATALAQNLSKILGRTIPVFKASILPSSLPNDYKNPNVISSLTKAIKGEYTWNDIFT